MWLKPNRKLAITLFWNMLQTNCVSGFRSSLRRCSQEAAVRFTSWLWDRTHCLTGNSWGCYSGINWWCLPSSLQICRVIFIFSADWCSSPWIRDMTQRPTIVVFFFLESIPLFLCPHLNLSFSERRILLPAETNSVGTWNSSWESCFSLLAATSSAAEVRTHFVPSCPYSPRETSNGLNQLTVWQILMSSWSLINIWTQLPVPPRCQLWILFT